MNGKDEQKHDDVVLSCVRRLGRVARTLLASNPQATRQVD